MNEELIKQKKDIEQEKVKLDKLFSKIAGVRLVTFIAAIILLFMGVSDKNTLLIAISVLLFVIFAFFVKYHAGIDDKILGINAKEDVLKRYIMRCSDAWKKFKDDGSDFLDTKDTLSYDLDLIGKNSLYQLINVAHTDLGRQRLADTLTLKKENVSRLEDRYSSIEELSEKKDFIIDFESTSERIVNRKIKEQEKKADFSGESIEEVSKKEQEQSEKAKDSKFASWMYLCMLLVPVANIIAIYMVLANGKSPSLILFSFIFGLVITWGPKVILDNIIEPVYKYGSSANDYNKLLSLIAGETFKTDILKSIHERVTSRDGLIQAIKQLGKIGTVNNISFNPIIHMVLSGFLGWDYYIALAASNWAKKNSGVFEECIDIVADIEELESLAVLRLIRKTTKPDIHFDNNLALKMENVYHPLISTETVVSNSAELDGKLTVITGSNMSGKTTFLRTVAINMVLAYTGSGVCADSFSAPFMKIFTSMRVMDDVSGGISTFYAEILRIKEMADYTTSKTDVPALCLIDEIFKGTNSADRIVGAEQALKKLSAANSMVLVSTHDFELCELKTEAGTPADNYHFEEHYVDNSLKFDYKIKDGRCTTRNAMAILKMAGLVQDSQ